jgi:glycosyltransferase involved in cell wall biosynthesis
MQMNAVLERADSSSGATSLPLDVSIAVLVPCMNESVAIASVVRDFRKALPRADVFVYDNASSDDTASVAQEARAIVRFEPVRGKGNVVRRMFADVEADVYVLVDGDDTYDASAAPRLIRVLLDEHLDMVNAARATDREDAYRSGHRFGNVLLTSTVAAIFGNRFSDMLSGYRVFSRRFVKSFPALSAGFEIETELTVHALALRMPIAEVETPYKERHPGSASKLKTFRDGFRILRTILILTKEERPLAFFTTVFAALAVTSLALAYPIFLTYERTGLVPRFPTAILATGIMLLAFLALSSGMILDSVTRGRREMKRLHYLTIDRRQGSQSARDASMASAPPEGSR